VLLEVPVYYEIKLKLLQRGTSYLYSTPYPTKPAIFRLLGYDKMICVDGLNHSCRLEEKRYGKAIMITKICRICDYGEIEVFPPHQKEVLAV